jgi:uncharacterized Zn-binding protein involved in type VI secretion
MKIVDRVLGQVRNPLQGKKDPMGKPAARVGDMTAHGGTITGPGVPTVLIGKMPAATLGDMHVCPMVTPGTPPIPHVGGPITLGSTGVLIGKKPAARMGDMAVCVGPPSTIVMGCMTVLIGEVGGGAAGGGGGGGGGAGGGSAAAGALTSASIAGQSPQTNPAATHFLDVTFEDKAKLPVGGVQYKITDPNNKVSETGVLAGQIKRLGVEQGSYTIDLRCIVNAQWSVKQANVDQDVNIAVDIMGVDSGEGATIKIFEQTRSGDLLRETIETTVSNDSIKARWKYTRREENAPLEIVDRTGGSLHLTHCYFTVDAAGCSERSGMLRINDELQLSLTNEQGKPVADEPYRVRLATGEIRQGKLDANGKAKEPRIPPGNVQVNFPNIENAKKLPS